MSNYTVTTNFTAKDTLPSGSTDRVVRGSEFGTEFNNIATAISSKVDSNNVDFIKLTNVTATATEINYLDGVTSNIQQQIDGIDSITYEEGTWTPSFDLLQQTPNNITASYVKVGKLVTLFMKMGNIRATSSSSPEMTITNLPFAAKDYGSFNYISSGRFVDQQQAGGFDVRHRSSTQLTAKLPQQIMGNIYLATYTYEATA